MNVLQMLADRTAVLFLGVAAGCAIGYSFSGVAHAPQSSLPAPSPTSDKAPIAASAAAAPDIECAMPFNQQLLDTVAKGEKIRVGVFGDSFGDGVWSALYRLLPAARNYQVIKFSQQSTGFTRYASLNLEEHTAQQLAADPVDIAVINFGANDTQGVMADGKFAALLSPEWKRVIGQRVDGLVNVLRARGAMVYWVGLPRMRKPSFDADIRGMDAFYQERMKALGVPFIEIAPLTVDQAGDYNAYLNDGAENKRTLIRANDGIHMSMTGYVRVTRGLADRIDRYVTAARAQAGISAPRGAGSAQSTPLAVPVAPVRAAPPPAPAPEPRRAASVAPSRPASPPTRAASRVQEAPPAPIMIEPMPSNDDQSMPPAQVRR